MRTYVAGHRGMVGGAILRRLEAKGVETITRAHAQLDLTDQRAVRAFMQAEKPDRVILAAAKVGGKLRAAFGLGMHQRMYDEALMAKLLSDAGFVIIRRCKFGDSDDLAFAAVEAEGRFVANGFDELALEARKA